MTAVPPLYEVDAGGRLTLRPNPAQIAVQDSRARITALICGTGAGKTSWGPWWLYFSIYGDGDRMPGLGGGDYLAVSATYKLMTRKMLPELTSVFCHTLNRGRYWPSSQIMELADPYGKFLAKTANDKMWGRIILGSAQNSDSLESATAKAAWLDECGQDGFRLESWQAILRRLGFYEGPAFLGSTPYNLGWLKVEILDRWLAGDPDYMVIQAPSTVNPAYSRKEYERARRTMVLSKFNMFYNGIFDRPEGLIYGSFTDELLVDDFEIPQSWPVWVGIDPGAVNTARIAVARNLDNGVLYIFSESLEGGKSTGEHVKDALAWASRYNVVGWFGGSASETQFRTDWQAAGIHVQQPPVGDVEAGIDRVYAQFAAKTIRVTRGMRGMRDELGTYSRETDANGKTTEKIKNKADFHRLDALRYVISGIDKGGGWVYIPGQEIINL